MSPAAERIGEMLSETFVVFDPFAATDPVEDIVDLGAAVGWDDDIDGFADRFGRGEAEQLLGRPVPAGDPAVKRLGDDGVVG
jgi:hypothetical protein